MKEHVSKEKRFPQGYWIIDEPPPELREIFENLWGKDFFPPFESLPSQITLTSELSDFVASEFATALEREEREATVNFLYSPDLGVLAGGRRRRGFRGRSQRGHDKRTLERYNLVFLGIVRPHPYRKEALFNQAEMEYLLSNPKDLFIIAVAQEGIRLAIKSQETKSGPEPPTYGRIEPLLLQYYKLCEPDCFRKIKAQHPEISGMKLKKMLRRQTEPVFNLRVAQEFFLGLYSSNVENPEILERIQ